MNDWSTPASVVDVVRRRWTSGVLLSSHARGEPFVPLSIPLRGPGAGEAATDLARVQQWAATLERGARRGGGTAYSLERRSLGGRALGRNDVPSRAVVDSYDDAWRLLGVEADVRAFDEIRALTDATLPALTLWMCEHPLRALPHAVAWPGVLSAVSWISAQGGSRRYLREIDVPGVDTKFIEQHRAILAELLEVILPPHRIEGRHSRGREFALRYGLAMPRPLLRLRVGAGVLPFPSGLQELGVRPDELATVAVPPCRVLVVENEISYLSVPTPPGWLVIFGSGYTVATLGELPWLAGCEIHYWGDLDTHGFAILDRLRAWWPHAQSVLMDRSTLLAHEDRWGAENTPTRSRLSRLTSPECDLYDDLVEDTFGTRIRLEQERIAWDHVVDALARLS